MNYADFSRLPPPLRSQVESELQSGERITWMDQPIAGRLARSSWGALLFDLPLTAFAIFWVTMAAMSVSKTKNSVLLWVFILFGVPFILAGLGMLSSPYWVRCSAQRSVYVLTDRCAIIFQGGWRGKISVRSFEPAALTDLKREQFADGSGNLGFALDWRLGGKGGPYATSVGFIAIRDVKNVEAMVLALARKGAAA